MRAFVMAATAACMLAACGQLGMGGNSGPPLPAPQPGVQAPSVQTRPTGNVEQVRISDANRQQILGNLNDLLNQAGNQFAPGMSPPQGFADENTNLQPGTYQVLVKGCTEKDGAPIDTQWWAINWDADVPPNTSLLVHAKASGASKIGDAAWNNAQWTPDAPVSPLLLQDVLQPNVSPMNPGEVVNDPYLLVEFVFKTQAQNASPKLKNFNVAFKCNQPPG